MHGDFWHERWRENRIGFHEDAEHPLLTRHWGTLGVDGGARVFVPLCGKSLDMVSLRAMGHEVVGVELSALAIQAFFAEQGLAVNREERQGFDRWHAPGYELLVGDFFCLEPASLGPVAAVYDRASLIALPLAMRSRYAQCMRALLDQGVRSLLITLNYDTPDMDGPPFSVTDEEVEALYGDWCDIDRVGRQPARVKGHDVEETAFVLTVR